MWLSALRPITGNQMVANRQTCSRYLGTPSAGVVITLQLPVSVQGPLDGANIEPVTSWPSTSMRMPLPEYAEARRAVMSRSALRRARDLPALLNNRGHLGLARAIVFST